jgi:hypothetical protein
MAGEGLSATRGRVAQRGSDWGITALVSGILLTYVCIGLGIYAVLSAIL